MKIKYIVSRVDGQKNQNVFKDTNFVRVMAKYAELCEEFPKENFKVCRSTTVEEIVGQSEDLRQTRFDFSN